MHCVERGQLLHRVGDGYHDLFRRLTAAAAAAGEVASASLPAMAARIATSMRLKVGRARLAGRPAGR